MMAAQKTASSRPLGSFGVATIILVTGSGYLGGCERSEIRNRQASVETLTLGQPVVEIGVLEGNDELVFGALEGVVRLGDGSIAVSDAGATRVSLFTDDGEFLRSWGSRGDGPGEFRSLSRIYPLGADSLMAAERHSGRLAVFDLQGEFGRLQAGQALTGDSVFTLDSWLAGRYWVDGALGTEARRRARATLARYPVPAEWPGYRYALAADNGDLWIRGPATDADSRRWIRLGADGPDAILTTPVSFRPTHIPSRDEVLGVWSDESGVHFVRVYTPKPDGGTAAVPTWMTDDAEPGPNASDLTEEELMSEIRSAVRLMASAQEIHYSSAMSYTTALDDLEAFEHPEAIAVDFVRADARGWAGVFTHASIDRVCALAYGFGTPPGWTPGMIICAPQVAPTDLETGAAR